MMSMMTRSQNSTRVRIALITVAALTLVLASAHLAQAASAPVCSESRPQHCTEMVWVNGVQVTMTFALAPFGATPSATIDPFYVIAPQTDTPQGGPVPFFHDHVVGDAPQQNHGDYNVILHGFLVFCSAQGISSGGCVPTFTSTPHRIIPLAKTVNGQMLTSADPIESPANSGLLVLVDTGALIVGTINPGG
jgi:hypothetical protein